MRHLGIGAVSIGRRSVATIALLALAVGIWLRLVALTKEGFWLDEIYSASFANLSAAGTLLAVFLYDVHPPLYYLQLNAWGVFGQGDYWLRLNSVAWSIGTLVTVFVGSTRQFGPRAGLLALMLCAVMGGDIYFAHELRMYSMEACVVVLSWVAANHLVADYRLRAALPLIILLAALGAIHSASIIPASAALLYVFPRGNLRQIRGLLPTWIGVGGIVACTFIPWIINSSLRNPVGHTTGASWHALMQTVGGWLIGYGDAVSLPVAESAAFVLVMGMLLAALLACQRLFRLVFCFILWPLAFAAILCVLVQPIWLDRTFAFCAPFVAIACGAGLGQWLGSHGSGKPNRLAYAVQGLFAALLLGSGWLAYLQATSAHEPDMYRELARYVDTNATRGELIYAPRLTDFWGLNRYLVGPNWGSALKFQDIADLDALKRWRRVYSLLGPERLQRLTLMPETRRLDSFRDSEYTGLSPLPEPLPATGEWLVSSEGEPLSPPGYWHLCTAQYPAPLKFGSLELYHWSCGAAN